MEAPRESTSVGEEGWDPLSRLGKNLAIPWESRANLAEAQGVCFGGDGAGWGLFSGKGEWEPMGSREQLGPFSGIESRGCDGMGKWG